MAANLFLFLGIAALAVALASFVKARGQFTTAGPKNHSRPIYHALNAAIWTMVPALVCMVLWLVLDESVVGWLVLAGIPGLNETDDTARSLLLAEIRQVASGNLFTEPSPQIVAAAERLQTLRGISLSMLAVVVASLAAAGASLAYRAITVRSTARHRVERSLTWFMMLASAIAIVTTIGIFASLIYESIAFFRLVPISEFLFGLRWEPQIAMRADQVAGQGSFGVIPVLFGTIVISMLAMLVAVPIGILSAIYLTEYAGKRFRATVKPMLEILAGIPTVVYGFFAVLAVAPLVRSIGFELGIPSAPNSALAAGAVMGIMIVPFVSSVSDDAFAAVPQSLRDGSYALGATKGETIRQVLFPAALPGIISGVLLALSRAIGETMIVVMAAGLIANMTLNPFESVTTVTVQIVTLLIGDSEFDNPKTLAAFALGLVLFLVTLGLNLIALTVVRKYREKY